LKAVIGSAFCPLAEFEGRNVDANAKSEAITRDVEKLNAGVLRLNMKTSNYHSSQAYMAASYLTERLEILQ
jgi:outer membrane murein-binding lipoprotein Lpp